MSVCNPVLHGLRRLKLVCLFGGGDGATISSTVSSLGATDASLSCALVGLELGVEVTVLSFGLGELLGLFGDALGDASEWPLGDFVFFELLGDLYEPELGDVPESLSSSPLADFVFCELLGDLYDQELGDPPEESPLGDFVFFELLGDLYEPELGDVPE